MRIETGGMIFVEKLSVVSWLWLLPFIIWLWFRGRVAIVGLYYFEISRGGKFVLELAKGIGFAYGERVDFSYVDVRKADGSSAGVSIEAIDSAEVCDSVWMAMFEGNPVVARYQKRFDENRVIVFLEKCLVQEFAPKLLLINVVSSYPNNQEKRAEGSPIFFVARTHWFRQLECYARKQGVCLEAYGWQSPLPRLSLCALWKIGALFGKRFFERRSPIGALVHNPSSPIPEDHSLSRGCIAMAYEGRGLTFDLTKRSDLFWVPFVQCAPDKLLVYFTAPDDLDREKLAVLKQASIRAVDKTSISGGEDLLGLMSEAVGLVPLLIRSLVTEPSKFTVNLWIAFQMLNFIRQYNGWLQFFRAFNVRVNVDSTAWVKERLPVDQAIADLGGICASYQFAAECYPEILRARVVDVHFGFSPFFVESDRRSGSNIGQFVAVGYVRDHAFSGVRGRADQLRKRLTGRGARFIVCFLDESFSEDKRCGPCRESQVANYEFLLARLLEERELGLIFKPKRPSTFQRLLEPCSDLLDEALATGRCFVFKDGVRTTDNLPCEASQASDVAIGLLCGTSPALESALAGTPTVLLDREGLAFHPFYALETAGMLFRDWESLWNTLWAHRRDPASVPGFGDWSPVLNRFDPFRDGRAAERIASYISWLAEGLEDGLSREETMEMARRRYVEIWGEDKVLEIRGNRIEHSFTTSFLG